MELTPPKIGGEIAGHVPPNRLANVPSSSEEAALFALENYHLSFF